MTPPNSLFEGSHKWEISVSNSEICRVHAMMLGIASRIDGRNVVWVTNIGNGTRRWFCQGYMTRAYVDAPGAPSDPTEPVVIPMEFLPAVEELVQEHGSASIYLNEDENVITCRAGDEYAVIDAYDDDELRPSFRPFLGRPLDRRRDGSARVKSSVFDRMANNYGVSHRTVKDLNGLAAFTTLSFERDKMRWTTDWTRWGKSATSGVCPAEVATRDFSVRFYPSALFSFFRYMPLPEEMEIVVDDVGNKKGNVSFLGDDFGVVVRLFSEGLSRYQSMLSDAFAGFGFSSLDDETDDEVEEFMRTTYADEGSVPDELLDFTFYSNGEVVIFVEIIPGTAGPDCIRLSNHVGDPLQSSPELLKELGTLNTELVNARLVQGPGGFVEIIVDIDNPRSPEQVQDGITNLFAAIGACDGFEQFLPLFAGTEAGPSAG